MTKRAVLRLGASVAAIVSLILTISLSIQYISAKQIQSHSTYTVGRVTKLYIIDDKTLTKTGVNHLYHYQVQYAFSPSSTTAQYHNDQGVSKADYDKLHVGGPINVYYDTQKPSVQSIAGYQSSPGQLGVLSIVTGLIFLCSVFVTIKLKKSHAASGSANQHEVSAPPTNQITSGVIQASPATATTSNSSLSSPVWFSYPQTGGVVNLNRHVLQGALIVSDEQLTINSDMEGQIVSHPINDVKLVKRWAPTMTFYFNDGSEFQIDFHDARQNKGALLGVFGSLFSLGGKNYKEALVNMKPFEEYFTGRNLLG